MGDLQQFAAYCIVSGFLMFFVLRGIHRLNSKIWVNHHPSKEPLVTKIILLWTFNSVLAFLAVAISLLYSVFITGIIPTSANITPKTLAAVGILFTVLNVVIRISTYGYIKSDGEWNITEERAKQRKETFKRSYFSLITSMVIFSFIGIGLTIFEYSTPSTGILETATIGDGFFYALVVIFAALVLSIISELLLWGGPLGVPEYLAD